MANQRIHLKKLIEQVFDDEITVGNDKVTRGLIIIRAMFKKAAEGDVMAFKLIAERMEGAPKQDMNISATVTAMPAITRDGSQMEFRIGRDVRDTEDT